MPELALHLVLLCFLILMVMSASLAAFAFAEPDEFLRWAAPIYWIFRNQSPKIIARVARFFAYAVGSVALFVDIGTCFVLGAWFSRNFFGFIHSPFSGWF